MTDDKSINASNSIETQYCALYKRDCIGGFCSAAIFSEGCIYLKPNNAPASGVNPTHSLETGI